MVTTGGISSDGCKLYSNELLLTAQESELGVDMGGYLVLSAVGQADDTVLMSNDIKLKLLLHLNNLMFSSVKARQNYL